MTQFPQQPYPQPVNYGAPGVGNPLGPARKAGLMMILLGCLALVCGTCAFGSSTLPFDQVAAQQGTPLNLPPGMTLAMVRTVLKIAGVVCFIAGIIELVLGVLVRKGGRTTALVAIAFTVLAIGWIGLNLVFSLASAPQNIAGLFMGLIVAGVFAAQIALLSKAYRAAPFIGQAHQAYQQQYAQFLAQQAAYQQQFGVQPPAAPAPLPTYAPPGYHTPPTGGVNSEPQTGWQWQPPTAPPPPPPEANG